MSKRSAPFSATNEPASKRSTTHSSSSSGSLTSFFPTTHTPRPPSPLVHSDPLTDRSSTFIAHAAPCTSSSSAASFQTYVRNLRTASHPVECSHEILGWRVVAPKVGKSGLESEEDWTVRDGGDDDGEKDGASTVRDVLRREGQVDVMVVVSRLYGGQMLGPARFTHIRTVTAQALARLSTALALPSLLSQLASLDNEIALLSNKEPTEVEREKTRVLYAGLDVGKAERLVSAREKRVELLRKQKVKKDEEERKEMEELQQRAEEEAIASVQEEEGLTAGGGAGGREDGAEAEEEDEAAAFEAWKREREEAKRKKQREKEAGADEKEV
ncbi:hypothetical protein JCM11251_001862 [Rhodosporidiobolus azoricus]